MGLGGMQRTCSGAEGATAVLAWVVGGVGLVTFAMLPSVANRQDAA